MWSANGLSISQWGDRPHSRGASTRLLPTAHTQLSVGSSPFVRPTSPPLPTDHGIAALMSSSVSAGSTMMMDGASSRPRTPLDRPKTPLGDMPFYGMSGSSAISMARPPSSVGGDRPRVLSSRASSRMSRSAGDGRGLTDWVKAQTGVFNTLSHKDWSSPDVIFDLIDADLSGSVSKVELRQFFRGSPLDVAKQEELFDALDMDGSGDVSREEWRAGFFAAGFDGSAIVGQSAAGLGVLLSLVQPPRLTNNPAGGKIHAFEDLTQGRPPARIPRVADRGITLGQLRSLWAHVVSRCDSEGWMDVNGQRLAADEVSMYDAVRYVLKPAARKDACSYAELVSPGPQQPSWVVIHWWGQPLVDILTCLEQHSTDRGVSDAIASYWIAACATNLHAAGPGFDAAAQQAVSDAVDVSFGTIALVDREARAYKRICFLFEAYLALKRNQEHGGGANTHKFDVYVVAQHVDRRRRVSESLGLADGFAMADFRAFERNKVAREAEFPLQFISAGLAPRLRESHAASEQDKRALLATIADMPPLAPARPGADAGGDADACVGIERALAGRMAVAAMRRVFDSGESALLNKCATSLAASGLRVVALNMSSCAAFTTATAELLAANLPCTIEYLSLHLNDVLAAAADAFVDGVAARLPSQLRRMRDICLYSNVLGENGCFALNRALRYASPALRTLDFGMPCPFRDVRVANALTAFKSPLTISYFGVGKLESDHLSLNGFGISTCDLILLSASVASGLPKGGLRSLDLAHNKVDNDGIGVLVKAIQAGHLPLLNWVDLSGNPASNKFEVLEALNSRNEKEHEKKRSERAAQGISSSTESLIYTRFTLAPMCEFRIVPLDDMDADPNDEDD